MKTWTRTEGAVRLSVDDGPPAREFLEDDYDDDNEELTPRGEVPPQTGGTHDGGAADGRERVAHTSV